LQNSAQLSLLSFVEAPVAAPAPTREKRSRKKTADPAPVAVTAPVAASATQEIVLVFDVETTGTDKRRDQVIELCVQRGLGAEATSRVWRFKPSVAIHPGAQAVHGISMEDLAECPAFGDCLDEIEQVFAEANVVIGYNLAFDIDMIQAEYERVGRPALDWNGKTIVDAFRLWQQFEPRSLQHAHQRFVGEAFAAAHSASADVAATGRVLQGMLSRFGLDGRDWNAIASAADPEGKLKQDRSSWVGPSRHLQWNDDGQIVMTFGKHVGVPLPHVVRLDAGYVRWVVGKDFPPHVLEICERALDLCTGRKRTETGDDAAAELVTWARQRYGQAAPTVQPAFAAAAAVAADPVPF